MNILSVSIAEAVRMIGISRSKIYQLISSGRLRTIKVGRRTLVPTASLKALIDGNVVSESTTAPVGSQPS